MTEEYNHRKGDTVPRDNARLMAHPETRGWIRRFTVESARADEYVRLYQSLGDEVLIEPLRPDLMKPQECTACFMAADSNCVVIYSRPRPQE